MAKCHPLATKKIYHKQLLIVLAFIKCNHMGHAWATLVHLPALFFRCGMGIGNSLFISLLQYFIELNVKCDIIIT